MDLIVRINVLAGRIRDHFAGKSKDHIFNVYAVPRGGIPVMYLLATHLKIFPVAHPAEADFIVDDLRDTAGTEARYKQYGKPFFVLIDKRVDFPERPWLVFPWEATEEKGIEDAFVRLLQYVGDDPTRGGLLETPTRAAKAWQFWCSGYGKDPAEVLKTFEDGAEKHDQMITVVNIPIYSKCEHHLADIIGTATISYIPNGKIVGLSKLNRLADIYSRRLQVQERMTDQIADALYEHLKPKGVGVCIKARHLCMESRGVCQQGHHTVTTALRGVILDEPSARAEFLQVAR